MSEVIKTVEELEAEKRLKLRNSRQESLIPAEKAQLANCVVIGCGAVGRQVAQMLAAMGVGNLQLWDHDLVEQENLAPQLYRENQLKANKAETTGTDCINLNTGIASKIITKPRRFARSDFKELTDKYVFMCVDSIDTRKNIFESAIKAKAKWIGDSRVAGEVIRVIADDTPAKNSKYQQTLFAQEEAYVGSCSTRMVVYGAVISAGMLIGKFAQNVRGAASGFSDHQFNMNGFDLFENNLTTIEVPVESNPETTLTSVDSNVPF